MRAVLGRWASRLGLFRASKFYFFARDYRGVSLHVKSRADLNIRLIKRDDVPVISEKLNKDFWEPFRQSSGGMVGTVGTDLVHWSLFVFDKVRQEFFDVDLQSESDSAFIYSMHTVPEYRGQAIAPKVVDAICSTLYQKGVRRFYLCVHVSNVPSILSVSKMGFIKIGLVIFVKVLGLRFCRVRGNTKSDGFVLRRMLRARS